MRQNLKPTRAELRETKRKLGVVRRGHKLLKRKQESLMATFFRDLDEYKRLQGETVEAVGGARRATTLSEMASGRMGSWSFAMTRAGRTGVKASRAMFMGVTLPDLTPCEGENRAGVLPGEPPENLEAALAAEGLVKRLVGLACAEARVRVLLDEIEKTKRRVNALEVRILPQLEEDQRFIQSRLEELERESLFSLKRIRAKKADVR